MKKHCKKREPSQLGKIQARYLQRSLKDFGLLGNML